MIAITHNGSYMKRSHARTLQLSTKLSGYVLYTVLVPVIYLIVNFLKLKYNEEN